VAVAGVVATLALAALLLASVASATTFEVTRTDDPAPGSCTVDECSLREAVIAANANQGPDTIDLPDATNAYELTQLNPIPVGTEPPAVSGDLDVTAGAITVQHSGDGRATIDATGIDRIFEVKDGSLRLQALTLTGGDNPSSKEGSGGAIAAFHPVRVIDSVISGNHARGSGGAIFAEGDNTAVTVLRSRIAGNSAALDGGAVAVVDINAVVVRQSALVGNSARSGVGGGAVVDANQPAVLDRTTIANNRAGGDAGGFVSTGSSSNAVVVTGTTISRNRSGGRGGGILNEAGTLQMVNSTVAGNRANGNGGGIFNLDQAELNAVTVAGNVADADRLGVTGSGGGIVEDQAARGFTVENSLIGLNHAPRRIQDCDAGQGAGFDSRGHNLLSSTTGCDGFDRASDLVNARPGIAALADNGGPTQTIALTANSPAIGKASARTTPALDQRGRRRDRHPDIGAFELLPGS
jgi:CSLREA domain-containing protein